MERRFEVRLRELLADAVVSPETFRGMLGRLERFVEPFAACLRTPEQQRHIREYAAGLLSNVGRKNVESIAYHHDQERQALQKFIGQCPWDHQPLLIELTRQVGHELGESDGVVVFDPSTFPKKGTESVGVDRQWCGRLGKVENCQVGVYMAYASRKEHALVNMRLYLPKSWAKTKSKARLRKCGVPKERRFQTRHELALEMLDETGPYLPHLWIAGDDEMGRSSQFRADLRGRQKCYVLAVPSNTLVRDLEQEPPAYTGLGRPRAIPFVRADKWCGALPPRAWTTITVRDGEKGPLVVQAVRTRMLAKTEKRSKRLCEETLLVIRERQGNGTLKHDYYLCHDDRVASFDTPLTELVRVARTTHRIEECFQRGKSEAGLADYEVRTWLGWHHHQTLSLVAAWFLTQEARREKKHDPCHDRAPGAGWIGHAVATRVAMRPPRETRPRCHTSPATQRRSETLSLQTT